MAKIEMLLLSGIFGLILLGILSEYMTVFKKKIYKYPQLGYFKKINENGGYGLCEWKPVFRLNLGLFSIFIYKPKRSFLLDDLGFEAVSKEE